MDNDYLMELATMGFQKEEEIYNTYVSRLSPFPRREIITIFTPTTKDVYLKNDENPNP